MKATSKKEDLEKALRDRKFNPLALEIAIKNGLDIWLIRAFLDLLEEESNSKKQK